MSTAASFRLKRNIIYHRTCFFSPLIGTEAGWGGGGGGWKRADDYFVHLFIRFTPRLPALQLSSRLSGGSPINFCCRRGGCFLSIPHPGLGLVCIDYIPGRWSSWNGLSLGLMLRFWRTSQPVWSGRSTAQLRKIEPRSEFLGIVLVGVLVVVVVWTRMFLLWLLSSQTRLSNLKKFPHPILYLYSTIKEVCLSMNL